MRSASPLVDSPLLRNIPGLNSLLKLPPRIPLINRLLTRHDKLVREPALDRQHSILAINSLPNQNERFQKPKLESLSQRPRESGHIILSVLAQGFLGLSVPFDQISPTDQKIETFEKSSKLENQSDDLDRVDSLVPLNSLGEFLCVFCIASFRYREVALIREDYMIGGQLDLLGHSLKPVHSLGVLDIFDLPEEFVVILRHSQRFLCKLSFFSR